MIDINKQLKSQDLEERLAQAKNIYKEKAVYQYEIMKIENEFLLKQQSEMQEENRCLHMEYEEALAILKEEAEKKSELLQHQLWEKEEEANKSKINMKKNSQKLKVLFQSIIERMGDKFRQKKEEWAMIKVAKQREKQLLQQQLLEKEEEINKLKIERE